MGTVAGVAAFVFLSRGTQAAQRSHCWLCMWCLWFLLLWVDRIPMVPPEAVCMEFHCPPFHVSVSQGMFSQSYSHLISIPEI